MLATALATLVASNLSIHGGLGLSAVHTPPQEYNFATDNIRGSSPDGLGISFEGQLEFSQFFVAATLLLAPLGEETERSMKPAGASIRLGVFLLPAAVSPYVALGIGWLTEVLPDGDSLANMVTASGAAVLAEVGLTGFRAWNAGRINLYVQIQKPLFDPPPEVPAHTPPVTKPVYLAGIRLMY